MLNEAEQREAVRLLRGSVVRALYRVITTGTRATAAYLARVCRPENSNAQAEAIAYLTASGYLSENVSRIDAGDRDPLITYHLTAKGMQLAERVIEDPSVIMD